MSHVFVCTPWLSFCLGDWDADLGGVVQKVITALETIIEFGDSPWSNDLDIGFKGIIGKLEADLVIPLACTPMGYCYTALALGNSNLSTGNYRTSK